MADHYRGAWPSNVQQRVASTQHQIVGTQRKVASPQYPIPSIQLQLDSIKRQIDRTFLKPSELIHLRQQFQDLLLNVDSKLQLANYTARTEDGNTLFDRDGHSHNRDTFCSTATTLANSKQSTPCASVFSADRFDICLPASSGTIEPQSKNLPDPTSSWFDASAPESCSTPKLTAIGTSESRSSNTVQDKASNVAYPVSEWGIVYSTELNHTDTPELSSVDAHHPDLPTPAESVLPSLPDASPNMLKESDLIDSQDASQDAESVEADSIDQTEALYSAWTGSARAWPAFNKPFYCTFCAEEGKTNPFKRKADWKRHEEDYHYGLGLKWCCEASGCQEEFFRGLDFKRHWKTRHQGKRLKQVISMPTTIWACGFDLQDCPQLYTGWEQRCKNVAEVMLQKRCPEWTFDMTIRNLLKHRELKSQWKQTFRSMATRYNITYSSQLYWTLDRASQMRNQLENYPLVPDMHALMKSLFEAGLRGRGNRVNPTVPFYTSQSSLQLSKSIQEISFVSPAPLSASFAPSQMATANLQASVRSHSVGPVADQALTNTAGNRASTMSITMTDAWSDTPTGTSPDYQDDEVTLASGQPALNFGNNPGHSANTALQMPMLYIAGDPHPTVSEHGRPTSKRGLRQKSMEFLKLKRPPPSIPSSNAISPPPSLPSVARYCNYQS